MPDGSGHLADSPPEYLASLQRGIAIQVGLAALGVLGGVVIFVAVRSVRVDFKSIEVAGEVGAFLTDLVFLGSVWLLTMPDPSGREPLSSDRARRLMRFACLVSIGALFLHPAVRHLAGVHGLEVTLPSFVFQAGMVALLYLRCSHIAVRVPDLRAARGARALMAGFPLCYGMTLLLTQFLPTPDPTTHPSVHSVLRLAFFMLLVAAGQLIVWIAGVVLIVRLWRDLRTARRSAAQHAVAPARANQSNVPFSTTSATDR